MNVAFSEAGVCGEEVKYDSPKNYCVGDQLMESVNVEGVIIQSLQLRICIFIGESTESTGL